MKIKFLNTAIVFLSILILSSCSVEDNINETNTNTEQNILLEKQPREQKIKSAPFALASITGCGYGFKVDMTLFALSSSQQFNYEVVLGTSVVNQGTVSQGMNTDWVLSPCTTYEFRFWGWPWTGPLTGHPPSQILTATTDGCGNVFIC